MERGFNECAQIDGRVANAGRAVRAGGVYCEFGGEALVMGDELRDALRRRVVTIAELARVEEVLPTRALRAHLELLAL